MNDQTAQPLPKTASLYQEFLAEREEILRHRDQLSEVAGHDVGFEHALVHWCRHCRDEWRAKRAAEREFEASPYEPAVVAD